MVGKPNPAQRARTRSAIERAALDLFAQHGFDAVTVEQIAEQAGVAARTVYRHYPVKELLVLEASPGDLDFAEATIADAHDAPPPSVYAQLVQRLAPSSHDVDDALLRLRLIHESPTLRAAHLQTSERFERVIAGFLATRSGRQAADPLVRAATATILAVHRVNNDLWFEARGRRSWQDVSAETSPLVEAALRLLEHPAAQHPAPAHR